MSDIAKILTSQEYNKFKYIIILTLLMFFLETISLVSIPLFATVLLNESILFENYKFLNNINLIKDAGQARLIFYCGILVIFSFVVKNLFLVFLIYFQGNFQKKMKINISKKLFEHYIRMPFLNHLEKNPANLSRYVSNEISGFNMYLQSLTLLLRESIAIVVIFLLLISSSPFKVTIILLVFGLIAAVFLKSIKKMIKNKANINIKLGQNLTQTIYETFGAIKDIKIQMKEDKIVEYFNTDISTLEKNNFYFYIFEKMPRIIMEFLSVGILLIFCFFYLNLDSDITSAIPTLSLLTICIVRFIPAFNAVTVSKYYMKIMKPSLNVLLEEFKHFELLQNKNIQSIKKDEKQNLNLDLSKNFISVKNLSFHYPGENTKPLKDINFEIQAGSFVGITGRTGSGKSTLFHIMMGLLKPNSGIICNEGENIFLNSNKWKKKIGYISQNIFLLNASLKKNIIFTFDDEEFDERKLNESIKIAQIQDKILSLPKGLETNIGIDGSKLSGGERQRLAIARAIYRNPEVIFMDESTSALDVKTEGIILDKIRNHFKGKTILMIAHRKSSLDKCDRILTLEEGKII